MPRNHIAASCFVLAVQLHLHNFSTVPSTCTICLYSHCFLFKMFRSYIHAFFVCPKRDVSRANYTRLPDVSVSSGHAPCLACRHPSSETTWLYTPVAGYSTLSPCIYIHPCCQRPPKWLGRLIKQEVAWRRITRKHEEHPSRVNKS